MGNVESADNVEMHEFYLNYKCYGDDSPVYRVALGELIDATKRETFKPGWMSFEYENDSAKSGSIGFMDVVIRCQLVPREDGNGREVKKTLTMLAIGVEPKHRRKGYARVLKQRAEEIAREWGLDTVVADCRLSNTEMTW